MVKAADDLMRLQTIPECPPAFLKNGKALSSDDAYTWVVNGAIATGMAVFSYLRDPNTDLAHKPAPPYYDECQRLP